MNWYLLTFIAIFISYSSCKSKKEEAYTVFPEIEQVVSNLYPAIGPNYDYLVDYVDSTLIVLNFEGDFCIGLYNRFTLEPILQGVTFGKGPNEVLSPTFLFTNKEYREFGILDSTGKKFLLFSIDSILLNSKFHPLKSIPLPKGGDFNFPVFPVDENSYISVNWAQNGHFLRFNENGETLDKSGSYPAEQLPGNLPEMMAGALYEGRYEINKSRDKLYKVYVHFDQISIFDTKGTELKTLQTGQTGLSQYDNVKYQNGRLLIDKKRFCYISSYVAEKYFYALYHGGPAGDSPEVLGNEIHVFDHEGTAVKKIPLDIPTSDIAVDEAGGIIYGINYAMDKPVILYNQHL